MIINKKNPGQTSKRSRLPISSTPARSKKGDQKAVTLEKDVSDEKGKAAVVGARTEVSGVATNKSKRDSRDRKAKGQTPADTHQLKKARSAAALGAMLTITPGDAEKRFEERKSKDDLSKPARVAFKEERAKGRKEQPRATTQGGRVLRRKKNPASTKAPGRARGQVDRTSIISMTKGPFDTGGAFVDPEGKPKPYIDCMASMDPETLARLEEYAGLTNRSTTCQFYESATTLLAVLGNPAALQQSAVSMVVKTLRKASAGPVMRNQWVYEVSDVLDRVEAAVRSVQGAQNIDGLRESLGKLTAELTAEHGSLNMLWCDFVEHQRSPFAKGGLFVSHDGINKNFDECKNLLSTDLKRQFDEFASDETTTRAITWGIYKAATSVVFQLREGQHPSKMRESLSVLGKLLPKLNLAPKWKDPIHQALKEFASASESRQAAAAALEKLVGFLAELEKPGHLMDSVWDQFVTAQVRAHEIAST